MLFSQPSDARLKSFIVFCLFGLLTWNISTSTLGEEQAEWTSVKDSPFSLKFEEDRERNLFIPPLLSFFLPGFDQWYEEQYGWAAFYSGTALGASVFSTIYSLSFLEGKTQEDVEDEVKRGLYSEDMNLRKAALAGQIWQTMGGFSAYHSFRTAVRTRKHDFPFLKKEETPGELFFAPFDFSHLSKPSTYIPLAAITAISLWQVTGGQDGMEAGDELKFQSRAFGSSDAVFAFGHSYQAGTHEEAFFRGYILPMAHSYTGSARTARWVDSILFALAHLNTVSLPLPQWILGYHLGGVVQDNDYGLQEAIFIHTWWDVLAFIGTYHYRLVDAPAAAKLPPPILWLPKLTWAF